tara:strand:- start:230 stop:907 length:678 start_codon:yes stop_codon:yes gene_type:complete
MLNKITVYGRLGKILGQRVFHAKINSVRDAFSFLKVNFSHLGLDRIEQNYIVKINNKNIKNEEEIDFPIGNGDVKIIPVAYGAKRAVKFFAVGAALIFTGGALAGGAANLGLFGGSAAGAITAGTTTATAAMFGNALAYLGASLVLTGISTALQPVFEDEQTQLGTGPGSDKSKNFAFNGITNTSASGIAIPVAYGEVFTGSIVVSAGIDAVQYAGQNKINKGAV